jgi:hypothetical protein
VRVRARGINPLTEVAGPLPKISISSTLEGNKEKFHDDAWRPGDICTLMSVVEKSQPLIRSKFSR